MVDLNITLWIQLANFLVTLVVLNYLLISPIRKIIRKRKDNVEGLIGEIEAFTAEKQQLLDEYESELRKAREAAAIYRKDGKVMGELERARTEACVVRTSDWASLLAASKMRARSSSPMTLPSLR